MLKISSKVLAETTGFNIDIYYFINNNDKKSLKKYT